MSRRVGPPPRRAPRLGPDERIAPYITRRGRFAEVDPLVAKPLPGVARVLGAVGWAALTVTSLRRARSAFAGGDAGHPPESGGALRPPGA